MLLAGKTQSIIVMPTEMNGEKALSGGIER
jgi:hypothetical protein